EEGLEDRGHLDVRQAYGLVQADGGGLGVGADLGGSCAQRVGGLQRVAALDAGPAALTAADVAVELADDGEAWDLGLVLMAERRFLDGVAAVRASVRQRGVVDFIDGGEAGAGRWPWRPCAAPALRPGLFGWALGGPLEKGAAWRLDSRLAASRP